MKVYHNLNFIYSWKFVYFLFIHENFIFTHFTLFMQSSCIFTYIFWTFSWFQNTHIRSNQNKIFKNRVFVKILQIRYLIIFSTFIFETSSYEFCFFQNLITIFFNFRIWLYNFFLLWKEEKISHKKKKKEFYFVILLFDADSFEIRIHWILHEVHIILNIVDYDYELEYRWILNIATET